MTTDNDDNKLLQQAALFDNVDLMESLLIGTACLHVDEQDLYGRTPLYTSITNNSLKCCHLLLMAGANPNIACTRECSGMTPLHAAAKDNKKRFLELLLDYNADINILDNLGRSPMDLAVKNGNIDCIDSIQMHIDLQSIKNVEIETTFVEACKIGNVQMAEGIMRSTNFTPKMIQTLINTFREQEHDLLYSVCRSGHAEMCEYLISLGAEVRLGPSSGLSPIHIACLAGHLDCVDILLKVFPYQVTVPTFEGSYPLHLASMQGHLKVVKLLVTILLCHSVCLDTDSSYSNETFESALNFRDSKCCTCLHLAVECGSVDVVRFLLSMSRAIENDAKDISDTKRSDKKSSPLINVDAVDGEGRTALHVAVTKYSDVTKEQSLEIIKLLLDYGADPNSKFEFVHNNKKEKCVSSALVESVKKQNREIVEILLSRGAKDENLVATKLSVRNEVECLIEIFLENLVCLDQENMVNSDALECFSGCNMPSNVGDILSGNNKIIYNKNFHNSLPGLKIDWSSLGLFKFYRAWFIRTGEKYCIDKVVLPTSLSMHVITDLDLSHNLLTELPFFVWQLCNLKKLNVSNNQLETIEISRPRSNSESSEDEVKQVYNSESTLVHLNRVDDIGGLECGIESRIKEASELFLHNNLEEINFQSNKLKTVPSQLFRMASLKRINISFNRISNLPFSVWTCTSLIELNASHNLLTELPYSPDPLHMSSSFCKNCNNSSRDVFFSTNNSSPDNSMHDNESFSRTDFEDESQLCFNHVNRWQETIKVQPSFYEEEEDSDVSKTNTSHLKELNLSFNLLEDIPVGLPCLVYRLEKLFLSNNQITKFGSVHNYPANLEVLDLSRNQISEDTYTRKMSSVILSPSISTSIPKICKSPLCLSNSYSPSNSPMLNSCKLISRCSYASLSNTPLTSSLNAACSHSSHYQLLKLKTLLLTFNCLKSFGFCCKDDQYLKSSFAPGDMLLKMPTVVFPNLITLDLSNNLLPVFPKEIGYLRNLSTLTMANNKMVDLPCEVGFLKKLWSLNFSGNPVNETLKFVLGDKMKVVKCVVSYLRSVMDEVVPFNHMKLMLVGRQGTGKTSLLQILVGDNYRNSHWISRRDKTMKDKDLKGENLSTVGVDIGDLVLSRESEEVIFSTWDFGGQREYYATHQYFLSKRSVYLVVWKIPDGEGGINEIFKWLVNIQARAPNSSVVIVGTHLDLAYKHFPVSFLEEMTSLIEKKYIKLVEPGRWGFPKVVGHVMVSCKPGMMSKSNYYHLHEIIWRAVDLSFDNTGTRLLDQKVPVNYIRLQKTIKAIVESRKNTNKDPVLNSDQYKQLVIETMEENFGASFQDVAELNQATQFLHENGVLLHYEDTNLKDIYFLDPQWLCDMLACIVTVRQINGLAINGVMRLDDLPILLKGVAFRSKDIKKYMIDLLHKFEVALQWDNIHLLIPSLLPTDKAGDQAFVMIPVSGEDNLSLQQYSVSLSAAPYINNPLILRCTNPSFSLFRLYTMSYFPAGFWPRLITRMLGDVSYSKLLKSLYDLSTLLSHNVDVDNLPGSYWHCWQTGLELRHLGLPILRVKEVSMSTSPGIFDYSKCHPVMKEDTDCTWYSVFMSDNSILEIIVYNESFTLQPCNEDALLTLYPITETVVRLLTTVVEQIDTLLEDWYPAVGTRFTKDIKGTLLINRLVPCTKCLMDQNKTITAAESSMSESRASTHHGHKVNSKERSNKFGSSQPSDSINALSFIRDCDSPDGVVYCFSIEHCIHVAQSNKVVSCPRHGNLGPYCTADEEGLIHFNHVAPDTVLYDLPPDLIVHPDNLLRTKFLGKGAFGAVYVGQVHLRNSLDATPVAIKMLRPIIPEEEIPLDLFRLFQKECDLWTRDPVSKCCEAYMIARKELSILLSLRHENVVSLVGICMSPPCLILSLAPLGCLNDHLRSFRKCGLKLPLYAVRDVIVQVSSALKYLHSKHIIYRDLKSENILVWSFPDWHLKWSMNPVTIKLADYGVSRVVLPSGTKGYAGTLPFMAPEIMVQNGEEAYTEKVDCYSFALLVYELISMKMPYEGETLLGTCGINLKSHVLAGGRPVLSLKEACYPTNTLDLMTLCWSPDPQERLSALDIELFARQPEFCSLLDVVTFTEDFHVICATSVPIPSLHSDIYPTEETSRHEILMFGSSHSGKNKPKDGSLFVFSFIEEGLGHIRKLNSGLERVVCMCVANDFVWCATERSFMYIYRIPEYSEVTKFPLAEPPTSVTCMCRIGNHLCVALDDGSFLFCFLYLGQSCSNDVLVDVLKFCGNGKLVHCLLYSHISNRHFLWCGQTQGSLVLWEFVNGSLEFIGSYGHFSSDIGLSDTVHIVSGQENSVHFFTYVYPGSVIYKWNSVQRKIEASVDISCVTPPLPVDVKLFNAGKQSQFSYCQVTCMSVVGGMLYVGTTFGCLLCLDSVLMSPVFSCRPHSSEPPNVFAVLPLSCPSEFCIGEASLEDEMNGHREKLHANHYKANKSLFVTIGVGYRSLIEGVLSSPMSQNVGENNSLKDQVHVLTWSDEIFRQF